jgi:hypothetical protein
MCLLFAIRVLLSRENKQRDAEPVDDAYDNVYLTKIDQDGKRVEMKVSKVCGTSSLVLSCANPSIRTRTGIFGFDGQTE